METRINKKNIGGISRALYIPVSGSPQTYYNAGKAGVDYRFLEYGVSYFASSPDDFNILENLSILRTQEFFGLGNNEVPGYDALENLYNTAIPCDITDTDGEEFYNYFGSFVSNQKYIFVFLVPPGIQKMRLFQDTTGTSGSDTDCDIYIEFSSDPEAKEVIEGKVVYLSITQVGVQGSKGVQVAYKSWMQLVNPVRHKPENLISVSDTRAEIPRIDRRGSVWYDMASGTIIGNKEIRRSAILDKKLQEIDKTQYSKWRVYMKGEKVLYPEAKRYEIKRTQDDTFIIPFAGDVVLYGNCQVLSVGLNGSSIWFTGYDRDNMITDGDKVKYIQSSNGPLLYKTTQSDISEGRLKELDKKDSSLVIRVSQAGSTLRVVSQPRSSESGVLCLESLKKWVSLTDNNIGNPPNILSPYWSTNDNLTDYFTSITEITCSKGEVIPSGLINVKSDTTKIGATLKLKPGYRASAENGNYGIEVTERRNPEGEIYFYVSVDKNSGWKRKYEVLVDTEAPDIYFKFPVFSRLKNTNISYSDEIKISNFYSGSIDNGVSIDIREAIKNVMAPMMEDLREYMDSESLGLFLDTQDFTISPEFPGMTIDNGVAYIPEVSIYGGTFKFIPENRMVNVLMANSYDFSVSNPFSPAPYSGIVDGLSFTSETGAIPGWIWIDKKLDTDGNPLKYSLEPLVNGETNVVVIDGNGYNFSKLTIRKDGDEYIIKIVDIKDTTKIDIIKA